MSGATERLSRLLNLVPYLTARPGARVEEVAAAFGIDERRLIDDLQLLFVCGLPGHLPDDLIEADFEGGVITVRNADTIARPLRLSSDEALALLVGLRTLSDVPGLQDRGALERATAKLERAAGDAVSALAEGAGIVARDGAQSPVRGDGPPDEASWLPTIRQALERGRRLHLRYYVPGRDETTERDADPIRLHVVEGRAYLQAYCRRVEDVRLFRLDRILALDMLEVAAEVPPDARTRDLDDGLFRPSPTDQQVTLELAPSVRWVADYYPTTHTAELPDGWLSASLSTPDTSWVRRLVLRLGGAARVVAPAELVAEVHDTAKRALSAYFQ